MEHDQWRSAAAADDERRNGIARRRATGAASRERIARPPGDVHAQQRNHAGEADDRPTSRRRVGRSPGEASDEHHDHQRHGRDQDRGEQQRNALARGDRRRRQLASQIASPHDGRFAVAQTARRRSATAGTTTRATPSRPRTPRHAPVDRDLDEQVWHAPDHGTGNEEQPGAWAHCAALYLRIDSGP